MTDWILHFLCSILINLEDWLLQAGLNIDTIFTTIKVLILKNERLLFDGGGTSLNTFVGTMGCILVPFHVFRSNVIVLKQLLRAEIFFPCHSK